MPDKYAVNQRIKEVMTALGETRVDPFYKKRWGKDAVSERLRTIVANETGVKIEFILEFTEKVAEIDGKKINGHWLLTGEGSMFLEEKGTAATNSTEAALLREAMQELREQLTFLRQQNTSLTEAFLKGKVVEQR